MNAVFVYIDGTVGLRAIECVPPTYRIPRRLPTSVAFDVFDPAATVTMTYDEYAVRGRMLDGRPIYCADGFDVRHAFMEILVSQREISVSPRHPLEMLASKLRALVDRECNNAFEVDYRGEEAPFNVVEQAQCIGQQGIRKFRVDAVLIAPKFAGMSRPRWAT